MKRWFVCFIAKAMPFVWLVSWAHAYTFIDVDEFDFVVSGKGLRVCVFDTEKQKYDSISYYKSNTVRGPTTDLNFNYRGIRVFSDGKVIVAKGLDSSCIVRTVGDIYSVREKETLFPAGWVTRDWCFEDIRKGKSCTSKILHCGIETLPARTLAVERLAYKTNVPFGHSFCVKRYENHSGRWQEAFPAWGFANLHEFKKGKGSELGYVGELALEMTMISAGYFIKLPSQNSMNQGIDGIYLTEGEDPQVFLTESKAQSLSVQKDSAEAIFFKGLKESDIRRRLSKMSRGDRGFLHQAFQESAATIIKLIEASSKNIWKMGHRLKSDGFCQYYAALFDFQAYNASMISGLSFESPAEEKCEAATRFLSTISNTDEEKIRLLLQSGVSPITMVKVAFEKLDATQRKELYSALVSLGNNQITGGKPQAEQAPSNNNHCKESPPTNDGAVFRSSTDEGGEQTISQGYPTTPPHTVSTPSRTGLVPIAFEHPEDGPAQAQLDYSPDNLKKVLPELMRTFGKKNLSEMAGFSGWNGGRDCDQMLVSPSIARWNNICNSLKEKGLSVEDFLPKA